LKSPICGISLITSPGEHLMSLLVKVWKLQHHGVWAD